MPTRGPHSVNSGMDPDVVHDPVFADLLLEFAGAGTRLRDAVIAMRSFYLHRHTRPIDESTSEKWRGAILGEEAAQHHEALVESAAQLLRYAFELAPVENSSLHMDGLLRLKSAHRERLERRTGWGKPAKVPGSIEEKVSIDRGPPITLLIDPKHWDYTERGKNAAQRRLNAGEPAITTETTQPPIEGSDVDTVE